ncbi:GHKL domain-containing protein [Candidatus Desantisbacteria bacterium]|nr:GHKL domain-containing protein [Candidatus Desantisbacteria bacterium]
MPLEKKIILSFFIASAIIGGFVISTYLGFIESRREIRYLELSDTIRSKSLLLRRHEKNFFLYGDAKERRFVHTYLKELKIILKKGTSFDEHRKLQFLRTDRNVCVTLDKKIAEYSQGFNHIESLAIDFQKGFAQLKASSNEHVAFFPIIESTFLERPMVNAELLERIFSIKRNASIIKTLKELDIEINTLRKNGEEVLNLTNELDKSARAKVEGVIRSTGFATLVFFPLFFGLGFVLLLVITHSVVSRLKALTEAVGKRGSTSGTGKGEFPSLSIPEKQDEVGILIKAFNKMEKDLLAREKEIDKKNEELLQNRKLASIGTLASGVAHELNNPLNNIYLASQTLSKEIAWDYPQIVKESVEDISSQVIRVKRIVHDLLEFAREMSPELKTIDIVELIQQVLGQTRGTAPTINLNSPQSLEVLADRHLLQQVFINLFSNAIESMDNNKGLLNVEIDTDKEDVQIKVSDTGKGILPENIHRIFDPFFTTKEKGTGLGLAIVYNIIKRHHGRIEVESMPDRGTTFTVILHK